MSVSSVKIYINMALEYLDSPYRVDDVEPNLVQAEQRLSNLSPADAAPLIAQIAEIRAKLDDIVKPADARQISAAQGKIHQARDYINTNNGRVTASDKEHIENLFQVAIQHLDQITDERKADKLKAPVLAEIAQIRTQYATNITAPPPPAKPTRPPPPSASYSSAKRSVFWAKEYFNTRIEQVEPELTKADQLLKGDNSMEATALVAEIAGLREKLADVIMPDDTRQVSAAQGKIRQARDYIDRNHGRVTESDKEHLETLFRGAIEYLDKITHPRKANELKAPVLAEIARIRAQYGTNAAAAAPPPPKPSTPPPPSASYSNAKRKVFWANSNFSTPGRIEQVEPDLVQAEELLKGDTSREADALREEIAELRKKLEDVVMPDDARQVSAAQMKIRQIRDYIDRNRNYLNKDEHREYIGLLCSQTIEQHLDKITNKRKANELKAPILAEIALIRQQHAITSNAPPLPSQTPSYSSPPHPPADMSSLSYEETSLLNRAKRTIGQARSSIESRRTEGVENLFFEASSTLSTLGDAYKAPLLSEIDGLRKELEATRLAEATRIITGELDRKLSSIESDIDYPDRFPYSVRSFKSRFEREDVRQSLTPEMYREYETRLANTLAAAAAAVKADKLNRAAPWLQKLLDKLSVNPFTDLDQSSANRVDSELRSMRWQVEKEVKQLPEDDADRIRIYEDLKATDAKFEAYSNEWGKAGASVLSQIANLYS